MKHVLGVKLRTRRLRSIHASVFGAFLGGSPHREDPKSRSLKGVPIKYPLS